MSGRAIRVLVVLAFGLVGSCGGGGGQGGGASEFLVTLFSTGAVDGTVDNTGNVTTGAASILTGDTVNNESLRGFVRFSLGLVPAGAVILNAQLRIYQTSTTLLNYTQLGNVMIDHIDIGGGLDAGDYSSAATLNDFATLSANASAVYKQVDVTARLEADVAGLKSDCDFRFHHVTATNADFAANTSTWNDGEDTSANGFVPKLFVVYALP